MLPPIAEELLAALEGLLADNDDLLEYNPDEGIACLLCGGPWLNWSSFCKHDKYCPVLVARAVITKAKEMQ